METEGAPRQEKGWEENHDFLTHNSVLIALRNLKIFFESDEGKGSMEARYSEAMDAAHRDGDELFRKITADLENPEMKEKTLEFIRLFIKDDVTRQMNDWAGYVRNNPGLEDYVKEKGSL
jgi:hypothetical protein